MGERLRSRNLECMSTIHDIVTYQYHKESTYTGRKYQRSTKSNKQKNPQKV